MNNVPKESQLFHSFIKERTYPHRHQVKQMLFLSLITSMLERMFYRTFMNQIMKCSVICFHRNNFNQSQKISDLCNEKKLPK